VAGGVAGGVAAAAAELDVSPGPVYLVRHAHAGDRSAWRGDDDRRPLSERGWRQAAGLVALLAPLPAPVRILSSPSLRCVQTVEPLARAHGLPVETDERLLEGARAEEALDLLEEEAARGALAACTHGDVVPGVLDLLRSRGARVDAPLTWPKASTWVLDGDDSGGLVAARYLPPPPA
jgi:8-oxo-(d)GTP phosphatase